MSHNQDAVFDVVIVGGGPTGLSCGIEAARVGLKYCIVEKGAITDAIRRFPVNMTFFSTPELLTLGGLPFPTTSVRPSRREALQYYRAVVEHFRLSLQLFTTVERIEPVQQTNQDGKQCPRFVLHTRRSTTPVDAAFGVHDVLHARNVVIATGYFDNTNRLNVEGEDLPHVSHYYDEAYKYAMADVVVIGGRNSAVETALELWRHGARVTLVHRRSALGTSVKYWVRPDIENRIKNGEISAYFDSVVRVIRPGSLDIEYLPTGELRRLKADFVFPLIGYRPDERLLRSAGVQLDEQTLIPQYNPATFETNVPGLYIAGSVACGCETWNIFIENGRAHAQPIMEHIAHTL
jgi:thioredoxin reductase (NADPH)